MSNMKRAVGPFKSYVHKGQAPAATHQGSGTYTYGDGDPGAKSGVRPGGEDHLQHKSLEDKGSVPYRRHHV